MASKNLDCNLDVSISEEFDKAYNTSTTLAFGGHTGCRYYALLKFEDLDLDTNAYNITSAKLTVTKIQGINAKGENIGFPDSFNAIARRVTSSWTESTNWTNKPKYISTGQSANVATGSGHSGKLTFDVTDIVQAWADGNSNYGLLLMQNGDTADRLKCIADRTSFNKAYITVTFEPKGAVYIDNGTKFEAYQIYIDNGSGWDLYTAHIDNGSSWDDCK